MDFLQLARERYSVRKFSDKKIELEKINVILEAGRVSPTACNYQPQRILVLESEENLAHLKKCTPFHFDAPLAFIVCYDSTVSWKSKDGRDLGVIDASIVTSHMMFEAVELGLGSTWVGHFDPKALREHFEIPDYLIPVAILPLGYPADDAQPHSLHSERDRKSVV